MAPTARHRRRDCEVLPAGTQFTGTNVSILTLYWYKSTNTDASVAGILNGALGEIAKK